MARPTLVLAPDWPRLLGRACAGDGLQAVYQPLVDLSRGEVVGYEGLIRFPSLVGVSPDRWFAAARAHGCEDRLEAAALSSVLAARPSLPPDLLLSVNVSPTTLASPLIARALAREPSLEGLVLELTEHSPVDCYADLSRLLNRHRERGALVAIDDAGSGYAGLAHILELRPSVLKLDRSLVEGVDRDEAKRVLIEMLGLYAGHLDAMVLAEGIETIDELETLRGLGVRLGQGWVLGRAAEPWAGVEPAARDALTRARHGRDGDGCTVGLLVERAHLFPAGAPDGPGAGPGEAGSAFVLAVDETGRPVGAATPAGGRGLVPVWLVSPGTPVADAALRAVSRPPDHRFDPLVCVDDGGRAVGVVHVERLLELLARLAGSDYDATG